MAQEVILDQGFVGLVPKKRGSKPALSIEGCNAAWQDEEFADWTVLRVDRAASRFSRWRFFEGLGVLFYLGRALLTRELMNVKQQMQKFRQAWTLDSVGLYSWLSMANVQTIIQQAPVHGSEVCPSLDKWGPPSSSIHVCHHEDQDRKRDGHTLFLMETSRFHQGKHSSPKRLLVPRHEFLCSMFDQGFQSFA